MPSLSPRIPFLSTNRSSAPARPRPLAPNSSPYVTKCGRRVKSREHQLGPLLHHHPSKLFSSPGEDCKPLRAAILSVLGNTTLGLAAAITLANLCPESIRSIFDAAHAQSSQQDASQASLPIPYSGSPHQVALSAPSTLFSSPNTASTFSSAASPPTTSPASASATSPLVATTTSTSASYLPSNLNIPTSLDHYFSSLTAAASAGKLHVTLFVSQPGWQRHSDSILRMLGSQGCGPASLASFAFVPLGPNYLQRARTAAAVMQREQGGLHDNRLSYMAGKYGMDVVLATGIAALAGAGCGGVMDTCPFMLMYDNTGLRATRSAGAAAGTAAGVAGSDGGDDGASYGGDGVSYSDARCWTVSPAWRMRQDLDEHVRRRLAILALAPAAAAALPQSLFVYGSNGQLKQRQQLLYGRDGVGEGAEAATTVVAREAAFASAW
ncbi:hypothetical protein Agub_g13607 [Astrephomene gubernaculifera]|uniref:Uncharacterized protein n=1 Tax=Astrephomene gubernaculifera TaxID=47775 RepID=A0AAD3HSH2_9CHLO|nr:hypothetical protein Agub_g13607 [Astrephomene gubernaculifera]